MTDIVALSGGEGDAPNDADPAHHVDIAGEVNKGYVGVVYFHGMGEQRRMEEVSRLVDAIDVYLTNAFRKRKEKKGYLTRVKTGYEVSRDPAAKGEQVTFLKTHHLYSKNDWGNDKARQARFYEAYWAPHMAKGRDPLGVVKWIGRQIIRPIFTLTTPWRERARLRRSVLAELYEEVMPEIGSDGFEDFHDVLREFNEFTGVGQKPDQEKAGFAKDASAFKAFQEKLAARFAHDKAKAARVAEIADAWYRRYVRIELRTLGALITAAVAALLVYGAMALLLFQLFSLIAGFDFFTDDNRPKWLVPSWANASASAITVLLALGAGRFLGRFMGDVEVWASLSETNELNSTRKKVIEEGVGILTHVLNDPKCHRVIVVSHSLGTSVAHDSLLVLARRNMGHDNGGDPMKGPVPLEKLRHFVTIASPIDKINYFFESYRTLYSSYSRYYEDVRGDIEAVPFSRNTKPYVHWVNYWDGADLIAGGIHSPVGTKSLENRVDNVHVPNLLFPSPGASHSAYFQSQTVISQVFEMIFLGTGNYDNANLNRNPNGVSGMNYRDVAFGPGTGQGTGLFYRAGAITLIWTAFFGVVTWLLGYRDLAFYLAIATAASGFTLMIGKASQFGFPHRDPL